MRIGIVRDTYFTTEPRGLNIANFLAVQGFEMYVLCYGDQPKVEKYHKITLVRFYLNKILKNKLKALIEVIPIYKYLWAYKIRKFIKRYQLDVLQVHDLYMLGAAIKANQKSNLPIVANFHENFAEAVYTYNWTKTIAGRLILMLSMWRVKEAKYLKFIDKLILLSENFKNDLLSKYSFLNSKDIVVYPNVPNIDEFKNYEIKKNIFRKLHYFDILYFGVIAERRGIFTVLEAMKLGIKKLPLRLILIGPVDTPDKKKFNMYLNDDTIKGRVMHFPWKDISEVPSFIDASDICISPIYKNLQHDSGVANKIFQYMLFGKPLLVSNSSEQKRIVETEKCGLVHQFDDVAEFMDKVEILYHNPTLRKEMGERGRRAVMLKYNTNVQSQNLIEMYSAMKANYQNFNH